MRTRAEFVRGHVPGALNAPLHTLTDPPAVVRRRPADELVVYCGHGPRARMARLLLRRLGCPVLLLEGHMAAWRRAGLPMERGPTDPDPDGGWMFRF